MQKIIFKKFLKEIKSIAIIAVVFIAVWLVLPANGAEAACKCIN